MKEKQSDIDKINEAVKKHQESKNALLPLVNKSEDLRRFVLDHDHQWDVLSEKQREEFRKEGRFLIAINILNKIALNILGTAARNRTENRVIAEDGDNRDEELQNKLLKYTNETKNNIDEIKEKQLTDGLFSYTGSWVKVVWGVVDRNPQIIKRVIDLSSVLFDPDSREYDLSDAKYVIESDFFDVDRLMMMYPGKADEIEEAHEKFRSKTGMSRWFDTVLSLFDDTKKVYTGDYVDMQDNNYRLIIYEYRKTVREDFFYDRATGQRSELNDSPVQKRLLKLQPSRFTVIRQASTQVWSRHCIPAMDILLKDEPNECQTGFYSYFRYAPFWMSGYLRESVPLFSNLKDGQVVMNKSMSTHIDFINAFNNPKTFITGGGEKLDPQTIAKITSRQKEVIELPHGKTHKVEQFSVNSDQLNVFQMIKDNMDDISGLRDSLLGESSSEDNASLYAQKVSQASTNLEPIFRNLRRTWRYIDKATVIMNQHYLTDPQVINIYGRDEVKGERLAINTVNPVTGEKFNDVSKGRFDIRIVEGPYNETAKLRNLQQMSAIFQSMPPELSYDMWDLFIQNTNMDASLLDEMVQRVQQKTLTLKKQQQDAAVMSLEQQQKQQEYQNTLDALKLKAEVAKNAKQPA